MSFLSDKEIEERLKSPDNLVNRLQIHQIERGRPSDVGNTPIEIKKTISILANDGETQTSLSRAFGVSTSNAHCYEKGKTSGGNEIPEIRKVIQKNRETAETLAIDSLLTSLNLLPDRLSKTKNAKTLSTVAKDMAEIANKMSGGVTDGDTKTVHLHLYAPPQSKVEDYDIIDV